MKFSTVLVLLGFLCAHSHCSTTDNEFLSSCLKYFYKQTPPKGFSQDRFKYICQRYEGTFYFATLYDTKNRIPVYSAYTIDELTCDGKQPSRRDNWFIEPELAGRHMAADMDTDKIASRSWSMPVQAINDDYKDTNYDRGHLAPNFMMCDTARTATFTLTNSVPQDACMNRIVWFDKEVKLKERFEAECPYSKAKRFIITGAIPSKDSFIPQKDLVVEDMLDRQTERVNVPKYMWTVACCDASDSIDPSAKSFFVGHIGENKAGGRMWDFEEVDTMNQQLSALYGLNTSMMVFADSCGSVNFTQIVQDVIG